MPTLSKRSPPTPPAPRPEPHRAVDRPRWERLQTAIMVVLFTGLIWWNANELVRSSRTYHLRIRPVQPPGMAVRVMSGEELNVTLSGSSRLLDAVSARLQAANGVIEYRIPRSDLRENAERVDAAARDVISQAAELEGVSVSEVTPATIGLQIDRLESVAMPITVDFGAAEVQGAAVAPTQVVVTMPQRELRQHPRKIRIDAEQAVRRWIRDNPGEANLSVRLAVPAIPRATAIEPANVTLTGTVVQFLSTQVKGPVQVQPAVPALVQQQFIVEPAQEGGFRTDVTVRGAKDDLAALNPEQIRAYVDVLTADVALAGQKITRRIIVVLPRGFELVGEPPEVTFQLTRRTGVRDGAP